MMTKGSHSDKVQEAQQKVVASQNQANQFGGMDTEFSLDESVQDAVGKSQQYEANSQQPTYEPNKPV